MVTYQICSQRLIKERLLLGLSQEELCLLLDISLEEYRTFEAGTQFPKENLLNLANYFHVSVDYLIGLTSEKKT